MIPSPSSRSLAYSAEDLDLWNATSSPDTYQDSYAYLVLQMMPAQALELTNLLKAAPYTQFVCKDILRAARLPGLGFENHIVKSNIVQLINGVKMDPVMLVRGIFERNTNLVIAGGYHRVSTAYLLHVESFVPCQIVDGPY